MRLNEVTISRAILEEQHRVLINYPEMDAAVVVGGPSGLACAALLGERGVRCALIEKKLSTGGGMWGDGRVGGLVINWTPVDMAGLHVGPLTVACTCTVDATGHDAMIARMVERKGAASR
jgi:ribulose 1,5-bisphosphate synthetase/thiazole synthase